MNGARPSAIEPEIARWREYVLARGSLTTADADELEDHLRGQIADLMSAGLTDDEAFLVAVKRMGGQAQVAREFARTHSKRLWRDLVLDGTTGRAGRRVGEAPAMLAFAAVAGLATRAPSLLIRDFQDRGFAYVMLSTALVMLTLSGYLAWRRHALRAIIVPGTAAAAGTALAIGYPFHGEPDTAVLAMIHLPIALWVALGIPYAGGDWRSRTARLDFIRFTGEWVIYMSLLAAGGGVLSGISLAVFQGLGIDISTAVMLWVVPLGAGGATIVAAWLVESKQEVLESIAPVLTKVFAPLATLALVAMLIGAIVGGGFQDSRDVLIAVDVLLVVVLGLVLYSISAQDPSGPTGWTDRLQVALVTTALLLDAVALSAILSRTLDGGLTPNRLVTVGVNLVLLANLAVTAWLYGRRLLRGTPLTPLLRWQTGYVPVFGAWAALVVIVVPPVFAFA
ncbi:permease prefix domain 1-containing protein [Demequina capsici]|uniref:Permease prefix domain 1-containing protein n=1 Tax=Demequina capsici TaxID=3075620 RepID=A0AA96F6I0_9MICO|nr:permease prefix domain 1-containing protein [Demequina sp. OYTSA14]WNM23650.1 permease prefix domain 1-containing protein [Demequina sp. OYTSA14]